MKIIKNIKVKAEKSIKNKKLKKTKKNPSLDWHHKIAESRGAAWKRALAQGKRESLLRPSLLKIARLEKNLKQADMAKNLSLSRAAYCAIERGRQAIKIDTANMIASKVDRVTISLFEKHESLENKFVARTKRL